MAEQNTSLVSRSEAAAFLPGLSSIDIPDDQLLPESRNPEFTAARFFAQKPEAYKAICTLLGEGVSHSAISRALGVSRNTVAAIYGREHKATPVEQSRLKACQEYGELAGLCRERARDMLLDDKQTFTPQGLGVLMGVSQDKAIALSGGVPIQVDVHVHRDDVGDLIAQAREKMRLASETAAAKGDPGCEVPAAFRAAIEAEVLEDVGADCLEDQVAPTGCPADGQLPRPGGPENQVGGH